MDQHFQVRYQPQWRFLDWKHHVIFLQPFCNPEQDLLPLCLGVAPPARPAYTCKRRGVQESHHNPFTNNECSSLHQVSGRMPCHDALCSNAVRRSHLYQMQCKFGDILHAGESLKNEDTTDTEMQHCSAGITKISIWTHDTGFLLVTALEVRLPLPGG
jgi:hypothetical protein